MKLLKSSLILSVFAIFLISCKTVAKNSNIKSISYTNTYGRGGLTTVKVTKEVIETEGRGGNVKDFPNYSKKMTAADWNSLTAGLDLKMLSQTKSGERRGVYDGHDEIFRIVTAEKEYEIFNASGDAKNYKQLEKLKTKLTALTAKYK